MAALVIQGLTKVFSLSKYLDPNLVTTFEAKTMFDAIDHMIDLLMNQGKIKNRDIFFQAIMEREKIVSTAIGMGVAIPHAKLPTYEDFFIAIGVLRGGVPWGTTLDDSLVRLIFMIGGPDDKQTEYLQILSKLTLAIKDEEKRKKLLTANSKESMIRLLST